MVYLLWHGYCGPRGSVRAPTVKTWHVKTYVDCRKSSDSFRIATKIIQSLLVATGERTGQTARKSAQNSRRSVAPSLLRGCSSSVDAAVKIRKLELEESKRCFSRIVHMLHVLSNRKECVGY